MKSNIEELLKSFYLISKKRWIKGVNNDVSGVGLTFEKELGKDVDDNIFPDFHDIEIKCTQRYSGYPIGLFNKTFDGPRLFETNYIVDTYGMDYYENSDKKYLFVNLMCWKKILVNDNYYFEMQLSKEDKKLYVLIYDLHNNLLDTAFIDFLSLEEHIKIKLSKLALIHASKQKMCDNNYFRYYSLSYYKLKSFDKFLELIENNVIKVSIMCRASFSKKDIGTQKNKGVNFKISKEDLEKLFDKILEFDTDNKTILINSEFIFNDVDILNTGDVNGETKSMDERIEEHLS